MSARKQTGWDAEERKPQSLKGIGLRTMVHKESTMGSLTSMAEIASAMVPNTGGYSTQFA